MASAGRSEERVRMTLVVRAPDIAERVMAEAWAAGALGVEEREDDRGVVMIVYLAAALARSDAPWLAGFAPAEVRCESVEALPDEDWSEAWKQGLEAIVISPRLVVRPSFVAHRASPGQCELIVDPGRAFGTGGHASTRLALEWVDALAGRGAGLRGARVLDVGTGSGVLALAALALGAERAVGFDLDDVAVREAASMASRNGLVERLDLFTGGIDALAHVRFDWVLANLLRSEMLPIAEAIAARVAPGGGLVLSGLLEADGPPVVEAFERLGLTSRGERSMRDAGGDRWIAPRLVRSV
jgi:ribosomal protein L11 methyltransferase